MVLHVCELAVDDAEVDLEELVGRAAELEGGDGRRRFQELAHDRPVARLPGPFQGQVGVLRRPPELLEDGPLRELPAALDPAGLPELELEARELQPDPAPAVLLGYQLQVELLGGGGVAVRLEREGDWVRGVEKGGTVGVTYERARARLSHEK